MPISYEDIRSWPPMWLRLFEDTEARMMEEGFVVTRQGFVDNLYNLPPMTPGQSELASVNNGEDDGIDFPHKWKGV